MLSQCPHCNQSVTLTGAQKVKVEEAFKVLKPGKALKFSCPQCKNSIELKKEEAAPGGKSVMRDVLDDLYSEHEEIAEQEVASLVERTKTEVPKPIKLPPTAPAPPDVNWLASEDFKEKEVVKDIPMTLIMMGEGPEREKVAAAFEKLGYQAEFTDSPESAMERMRFVNFAAVVLHTGFEGGTPEESEFHQYMINLPMDIRRYMFYVLIGPRFHTLYDLEALAHSANVVVNDNEIDLMETILKKGLNDYEDIFGPLIAVLKEHGKR